MSRPAEIAVAVMNGLVGDYLARRGNGLATEMSFVRDGEVVPVAALGVDRPRVVVLVHGLMAEEGCFLFPDGSTYGSRLAADLGFFPLLVRYNSGLAIPDNGARLASLLQDLVDAWPIEEIVVIAHSMGGLVVRAACHVACASSFGWIRLVRQDFFLGTPHLGAPLERAGRVLNKVLHVVPDPVTRLVAVIADLRSEGLKDLGDAALREEDRGRGEWLRNPEHPVPLLPQIHHHLVAATLAKDPRLGALFGDLVVPLDSATGGPAHDTLVVPGVSHVALCHDDRVYRKLLAWLQEVA